MRIHETVRNGVVVLAPRGRITVETEAEFSQAVRRLIETGQTRLVLNLAEVSSIDSCGLGAIAQAYVSAWLRGGTLKLANVARRNYRLLSVTRLDTVFEVFDSEEEAVGSFGPAAHGLPTGGSGMHAAGRLEFGTIL